MLVSDLISKLQEMPQDAPVELEIYDSAEGLHSRMWGDLKLVHLEGDTANLFANFDKQ